MNENQLKTNLAGGLKTVDSLLNLLQQEEIYKSAVKIRVALISLQMWLEDALKELK